MLPKSISFVDIETTGTGVTYSRIIEIGILRIENNKVVKKFSSLINPETTLDPFISQFTGIRQEEVENAPTFYDLKDEILELLTNSVFAAHNVRFDYGFLRNEFKRYDIRFSSKHFCTIKLAKLLYPGMRNYNLDSIIENFQIKCKRRHRAFDDANAIWDLYRKSLHKIPKDTFIKALNIALKQPSIPLGINQKILDALPETPGVYILYGDKGMPLYIGKSVNIKDRVLSHFSSDYLSQKDMKISREVKSIEALPTAGELGALFLESSLIKKYQPLYNRQLRLTRKLIALKKITDTNGFNTVKITNLDEVSIQSLEEVIGVFKSLKQLKDTLYEISKEYSLCHKLLNLEKTNKFCFSYHLGKCKGACLGKEHNLKYNLRFDEAFYKYKIKSWPFAGPIIIKEKGEKEEAFVIDKWCYLGNLKDSYSINELRTKYSFDYDKYKILRRFINNGKNIRIEELKKTTLSSYQNHFQ